jgi:hypothetical protein
MNFQEMPAVWRKTVTKSGIVLSVTKLQTHNLKVKYTLAKALAIPLDISLYRMRQKALCTPARWMLSFAVRGAFPYIKHFRLRK